MARVGYQLGHCGLVSPVDIDGSLWDPTGYWTLNGAPATPAQEGELINATSVEVVLTLPNTLEMRTPAGLTVVPRTTRRPARLLPV